MDKHSRDSAFGEADGSITRVPQREQGLFIFMGPALQENINKVRASAFPENISTKTPENRGHVVSHFSDGCTLQMGTQLKEQGRTNMQGSSRHTEIVAWSSTHPRRGTSSNVQRQQKAGGDLDKQCLISYSVFPSHISRLQTFKPGHGDI